MDKAGIQQLVEQLELAMRRIPAPEAGTRFASMKGKLSAPVKAAIHARFGTDSNGVSRQGLTFEANSGESVLAVHTGRVVFADWAGDVVAKAGRGAGENAGLHFEIRKGGIALNPEAWLTQ